MVYRLMHNDIFFYTGVLLGICTNMVIFETVK